MNTARTLNLTSVCLAMVALFIVAASPSALLASPEAEEKQREILVDQELLPVGVENSEFHEGLAAMNWSLASAAALGADGDAGSDDDWIFRASLYGWLPTINGDASVRGLNSDVGASFSDVLDSLELGAFGRVSAGKGRFYVYGEATYANLSSDEQVATVKIDFDLEYAVFDLGVGFAVLQKTIGDSEHETLALSVFGGTRIQYLKGTLDPQIVGRLSRSSDWAELLFGSELRLGLSERASAAISLDFSGFDIGTGSTLTWNFWGALRYALTSNLGVFAGYRILGLDYSRNSGADKLGTNMTMNGPILGLNYTF